MKRPKRVRKLILLMAVFLIGCDRLPDCGDAKGILCYKTRCREACLQYETSTAFKVTTLDDDNLLSEWVVPKELYTFEKPKEVRHA